MTKLNPSFSRTYLRRDNYYGPQLLRSIGARALPTTQVAKSTVSPTLGPSVKRQMNKDDDLLVYSQPLSSDEEDYQTTPRTSSKDVKNEPVKSSVPSPKRAATTAASSRSKRRKLKDEPTAPSFVIPEPTPSTELFPEWNSSGSQKRRQLKTYAQRKDFQKPDPIDQKASVERKPSFVSHDALEPVDTKPKSKTNFVNTPPLPLVEDQAKPPRSKQKLLVAVLPEEKTEVKESGFRLPTLPDFASSATTVDSDIPSIFEARLSPGQKSHHTRSVSSSSLSSARSLSPLSHDIDLPPVSHRCPVCRKFVTDSTRLFVPDNLRKLSLRGQQDFCSQHQLADAKDLWEERNYPDIDWEDLEHRRIPEQTKLLRKTILRQRGSFYLDELDRRIESAKGDRKKIQHYLNQGLVDVVKPGYYGPKGARIMINAITESLTTVLVEALQSDSAIRLAGVGAYVSAVLVPELTLILVMDDMQLKDREEARQVLEESSHIGVLLHPDDDHIERSEDDI